MEGKKVVFYVVAALTVLAVVLLPGLSKLHKLRRENVQLQKRIRLLKEHNGVLTEEITNMQQDPGYVETKAREKLGILKKGEMIYEPATERKKR
jgi:cell division protein FtsB